MKTILIKKYTVDNAVTVKSIELIATECNGLAFKNDDVNNIKKQVSFDVVINFVEGHKTQDHCEELEVAYSYFDQYREAFESQK